MSTSSLLRLVSYIAGLTGFAASFFGDDNAAATFSMASAIWLWQLGDDENVDA